MSLKTIKTTIEVVDYKDLKTKLDLLGITRMKIAKDLNISPAMLSRWTTGKQFVPDNKVDELNEYIDKKSKEIMEFWNADARASALKEIGYYADTIKAIGEANKNKTHCNNCFSKNTSKCQSCVEFCNFIPKDFAGGKIHD